MCRDPLKLQWAVVSWFRWDFGDDRRAFCPCAKWWLRGAEIGFVGPFTVGGDAVVYGDGVLEHQYLFRWDDKSVVLSKLKVADAKSPVKMRLVVELEGMQKTRPSWRSTPLEKALMPGYVPAGVVRLSVAGL